MTSKNINPNCSYIFPVSNYTVLSSGSSCEASGHSRITSLAECQTAPQELGISFTKKGTVENHHTAYGCYLNIDGDLWYNVKEQSTAPCNSGSKCVCKTGIIVLHVFLKTRAIASILYYFHCCPQNERSKNSH